MLRSKSQGGLTSENRTATSHRKVSRGIETASVKQPLIEPLYSFANAYSRAPARRCSEFLTIRHVVALIANAPVIHLHFGRAALESSDQIQQFRETDGIPE